METCFVSCKKNTANENLSVRKTKQNRLMLLSSGAIYGRTNKLLKNKKLHNFNN